MYIFVYFDVFTAPLRSNERGDDHRKHRFSIVARVRYRGNVFSEPLPSNELFWLSGVMSQYVIYSCWSRRFYRDTRDVHTAIIIQCEQFTSAVETEARSWRRKFT
jgi:hypothetical protein